MRYVLPVLLCFASVACAEIPLAEDTAYSTIAVNSVPLVDATDGVTVETAIAYNESGMALRWNFINTATGAFSSTAVTPTTGGVYDWAHAGGGMYTIELPASGGASANNDTAGIGWFSGTTSSCAPFSGPKYAFSVYEDTTGTAAAVSSKLQTDMQADPTGFHVNVLEVGGTAQTANDNGADINAILADTGTDGVVLANDAITAAKIAADAIGSSELAATATGEIADAVWDEDIVAAHNTEDSAADVLKDTDTAVNVASIDAGAITASALATDAVTEIVAGVWNATLSTYSATANSVAEKVSKIIEVGTQYRYTNQDDGGTPAAADDVTITVP